MDLLLVGLLVLAVAAVVAVALGRVRGGMAPVDGTEPPLAEPVSRPTDLDRVRFGLALRGYRMDQVDAVLDEARDLLAAQEEELAGLRLPGRSGHVPGDRPGDRVEDPLDDRPGDRSVDRPDDPGARPTDEVSQQARTPVPAVPPLAQPAEHPADHPRAQPVDHAVDRPVDP